MATPEDPAQPRIAVTARGTVGLAFDDRALDDGSLRAGLDVDVYPLRPTRAGQGFFFRGVVEWDSLFSLDDSCATCSAHQVAAGLMFGFVFASNRKEAGWLAVGAGYRRYERSDTAPAPNHAESDDGVDVLRFELGYDWRVRHFRVGYFIAVAIGCFASRSGHASTCTDDFSPSRQVGLGVRVGFDVSP